MKEKITAVIIAYKAEATIAACVRALGFCDRILVAEHQSPDRTAELARQAGAEVLDVVWQGFAKTKNQVIAMVASGWVLSVDADEIISPALAQEIQAMVEKTTTVAGYWISRRNYFLGQEIRHCGWRPDWQLRLFRAGSGQFEERAVHEALQVQGATAQLRQRMDHYTYASLEDYFSRLNAYTTLAATERWRRGRRFSMVRLLLDPVWTFIKMFGIKSGWRDGYAGLALCLLSSFNTFVKYAKLWERQKHESGTGGAHV